MTTVTLSRRSVLAASGAGALLGGRVVAEDDAEQPRDHGPYAALLIEPGWAWLGSGDGQGLLREPRILIQGDRIAAINPGEVPEGAPRLRFPRSILMPGFISGHTHVCGGTPTRGIIEGGRSYNRALSMVETLSDEDLDALTAFNLAELMLSGCTTQVEMSLTLRQAESYVRVAKRWGARGYPGPMIPGRMRLYPIWFRSDDQVLFDSEEETLAEVQAALEFGRRHAGAGEGRIQPMMSPHACDTQTAATMAAIGKAAAELGTGVHIHLSQGSQETEAVKRVWGKTPTQWCEEHGLFDGPFFGAHMSGLDWPTDAPILKKHGAVFAHCPSAGGAGGGSMPYPEGLGHGLAVNVGIDTHSNDFLENLKLAVLYGQARYFLMRGKTDLPIKQPSIEDAVHGATVVPADALGRPDLGRIAAGSKADLTAIDVGDFLVGGGALPPEPLNNLLYANGKSVHFTMTDGRVQVQEGRLVADDHAEVSRRGGEVLSKIWQQLETEGWFETSG